MTDNAAWEAMLKLITVLEFSGEGKEFDTGDYDKVCPVCYPMLGRSHDKDCELATAKEAIGRMLYGEIGWVDKQNEVEK